MIPARSIKNGANFLKKPITYIVNLSFTSEIVADESCYYQTTVLRGGVLDVGNYRLVSILSIVSMVLVSCKSFRPT